MSNPSNSLAEQLKTMNRRANQMATMHSKLRDDYAWWNSATNFFLLIFSACLLSLAFISDDFLQRTIGMSPDTFKWVNGITATANFSVSLIHLAWVKSLPGTPVFVAYPAGFDFLFVYWYLIRFAAQNVVERQ